MNIGRPFAHIVSWVFNPGFLIIALLGLSVVTSYDSQLLSQRAFWGWLFSLVVMTLFGAVIIFYAWVRGIVLDADLMTPVRKSDRSKMLLVFLGFILILLVASFRGAQPQPLHAALVTILILGLVVAAISLVWKISLHMLGVSTLVTTILLIVGPHAWLVSLLIPLVGWARIHLHRHTPYQVLGGTLLGFVFTSAVFWLYRLV